MVANAKRLEKIPMNGYANSNRATTAMNASTSTACISVTAKCVAFANQMVALRKVKNASPKQNAAAEDAEKMLEAARAENANRLEPLMLGNRAFIGASLIQ